MGDGEGSDPMSRPRIIITPPGKIPGTPILMSRPRHRQEGGPPCDFTGLPVRLDYPRGSRGLEWAGRERDVRPRPRTTYRTRSPAAATDVHRSIGTLDKSWRQPAVDSASGRAPMPYPYTVPTAAQIQQWSILTALSGILNTWRDRKSTRLNSSHLGISYAVFCLKKKKKKNY